MSTAPDTTLALTPWAGSGLATFVFADLEIPSDITGIGTQQQIAVHKMIGGARQLDAMGVDYPPITWSALFFGDGATDRVLQLKALAAAGQPLTLTWHAFNYTVIIKSFDPDERRQFEIPYRITCEIAQDNSNPDSTTAPVNINDATNAQLGVAQGLVALLAAQAQGIYAQVISQIETTIALVATAIQAPQELLITGLINASPATVFSILMPLASCQASVSTLIALSDAAIGALPGFGGVLVGSDAMTMTANLTAALDTMEQESTALALAAILDVMESNLSSINGSPNTIAVAGGNLYAIAAQQYGDPTLWTAIAAANPFLNGDPQITGPTILTIPLNPSNTGGVLNA